MRKYYLEIETTDGTIKKVVGAGKNFLAAYDAIKVEYNAVHLLSASSPGKVTQEYRKDPMTGRTFTGGKETTNV